MVTGRFLLNTQQYLSARQNLTNYQERKRQGTVFRSQAAVKFTTLSPATAVQLILGCSA